MKLYSINKNYINYLREFDSKIMKPDGTNYKKEKLYIGILLNIGKNSFFAPLSSSKAKDYIENKPKKDSLTIIYLIDPQNKNKILGKISLNNMIPIKDMSVAKICNINFEQDIKYKFLLLKEYSEILKKKKDILKKAKITYQIKSNEKNQKIAKYCVNFKLLEEKALEWEKRKLIEKKENYNCLTGNPIEIENHASGKTKWISKTDVMKHKVEIKPNAKAVQINVVHIEEERLYMKPVSYYNISELCITKDLEQRFKPRKEKIQQKIKEKDRGMEM